MRGQFPLFQSPIDLAHHYWANILKQGDIAIDATCGNGWDTLVLAKLFSGKLFSFDIQEAAIESTHALLNKELSEEVRNRIEIIHGSHAAFPSWIETAKLIVYNLGYLPGAGNKELTTKTESTIASLQQALKLLSSGGMISITCYPGHPEGEKEEKALIAFVEKLDPKTWSCCHHRWLNRRSSPSLLVIQRAY